MISFKGAQFPKEVTLFAVFLYVRYTVSYRDLEEIMAERGVTVDHATFNRCVAKYSPLIDHKARRRKAPANRSWRMDETYVKVKGEWFISTVLSTSWAKPWTSRSRNGETWLLRPFFFARA